MDGGSDRRAPDADEPQITPAGQPHDEPEEDDGVDGVEAVDDEPDDDRSEPEPEPATRPERREHDEPRRRALDPRHVPKAFTAVEGRYADVAVAPVWRRLLSLTGILLIAVTIGVGVAALLGAVIGAASEILGNTIG